MIGLSDTITCSNNSESKDLLRFIACGSVDDGKSTLIGRLLFESKGVFEDQLEALSVDSKKFGTTGEEIDFALLLDGLAAEREQGITIDVAYRYFSTEKRKFIVADTPGHEQYTRNMATGASTADLAIIMIDASKGITTQTRRHSYIVSMLGVKHVVLAINKMDLIYYNPSIFSQIEGHYRQFAASLDFKHIHVIPVSALCGDNIVSKSERMLWYEGPTLLSYLEDVEINNASQEGYFHLPVQWVNRPNPDFRGFAGRIAAGTVKTGDRVVIMPSKKETHVARIVTYDGDLAVASQGQSVTLTLADEVDVSRGDIIMDPSLSPEISEQVQARLLWMSDKPMVSARQYLMKIGTATVHCSLSKPKARVDMKTLDSVATTTLYLNEIGICDIYIDRPIVVEPYINSRILGSFILIDRLSHETIAAGMILHSLRRSTNVHLQTQTVDRAARISLMNHNPCVLWLTGLSGAGKSTIANCLEQKLNCLGKHTIMLDGDNIRHGLTKDLGFTEADRAENIRRVAEVAKLMTDAGLITLVALISPFEEERQMARNIIGVDQFIEVFVDTPLEISEGRDVKGLYKKARAGEIPNFTGINSPYEVPKNPDIHLMTEGTSSDVLADSIIQTLLDKGIL